MSQIATLTTGAGVNTIVGPVSQLESCIVIGDVDTAMPLQGIKVNVAGDTIIDIQNSQPLVSAFAKFMGNLVGTVVGMVMVVATGRILKSTTITFTNGGATTPAIYAYSLEGRGVPVRATTTLINASSNQTFDKFSALQVLIANVSSFDVTFNDADNTTQNMTVVEMDALFTQGNASQTDGRLDAAVTTIDNRGQLFKSVRINTTAGGGVTVTVIKLPDDQFKAVLAQGAMG